MYFLEEKKYGICSLLAWKSLEQNINGLWTVRHGDDSTFSRPQTELDITVCFRTSTEISNLETFHLNTVDQS